ncbi:MAG: alpha-ketoglutarate-dependent dioxygenase AlkB [Myxococcota bacterium]
MRPPLALPDWLAAALAAEMGSGRCEPSAVAATADAAGSGPARRLHRFDPARQCAPTLPGFTGVRVYPDALSRAEVEALLTTIEALPFKPSQSGKQKQHFGPRVNYLRRRINADRFAGLPVYARGLEQRLRDRVGDDGAGDPVDLARCRAALAAFETTDVFVLRYVAAEQSNLDFHVDDLYAYGEAIVDVSLESDSTLTFLGPCGDDRPEAEQQGIRVPLPARSLAVVYGPARVAWQHAILSADVRSIRTSITLRTLAPALRSTETGRRVLARIRGGADGEAPDGASAPPRRKPG